LGSIAAWLFIDQSDKDKAVSTIIVFIVTPLPNL
jgi:hypothetical protein